MFEKLLEMNLEWDKIEGFKDIPDDAFEAFRDRFDQCINDCKIKIKNKEDKEVERAIKAEITNKRFQRCITNVLDNALFGYKSMEPVRKLQEKDSLLVYNLINDIFDNKIIRNNIYFEESYCDYKIKTQTEFENIISTLYTLTRFYVVQRFTQKSIMDDFGMELGLNEGISQKFAENIEKNFETLQRGLLLEELYARKGNY